MSLMIKRLFICTVALMMCLLVFSTLPATTGSEMKLGSEYYDQNRLLEVKTNKMYYRPGEEVAITIHNRADMTIGFDTDPKFVIKDENGNVVYPLASLRRPSGQEQMESTWNLPAGAKEMYRWDQATLTLPELPGGVYTIETVSTLPDYMEGITPLLIREKGYVLIVAGNNNDDKQDRINEACNQIYDDMISIGYMAGDIYYLNGWDNHRVDDVATSDNVEDAIKVWAADRVSLTDPLFIVFFDHGGNNNFCIDNDVVGNDNVFANELSDWIGDLQEETNTEVFMWYMGCHSGSFIDEVSGDKRIIMTSSRATENSGTAPAPYHEKSASQYWPAIKAGDSLGQAFDTGSHYVAETLGSYHPLLDDNGDGVGHGWDTPDPSGYLPHDGDGYYADHVYMGSDDEEPLFIADILARQAFEWPFPPEEIRLDIGLDMDPKDLTVIASMILPGYAAAYDGEFLLDEQYLDFEMEDPEGDGTWTVSIPAEVIMEHYKRPGMVQFIINGHDGMGQTITPQTASVEFTQDGNPSPDNTPPDIRILTPKPQDILDGVGVLEAIASDDSCLDKAEIYIDDMLIDTVDLPSSSSSHYFEYERDTSELSDGIYTLTVMVYDCAGNSISKSMEITILNNPAGPTPAMLKQEAIRLLEEVDVGDKKLSRMVDDTIGNIQASLDQDLWVDGSHLDPKHSHKVFGSEKKAIMNLWQISDDDIITPEGLRTTGLEAAMLLLEADHALARTLYRESSKLHGDEFLDRELYSAESALTAAAMELNDPDGNQEIKYFKALDLYRKAWHHGHLARSHSCGCFETNVD